MKRSNFWIFYAIFLASSLSFSCVFLAEAPASEPWKKIADKGIDNPEIPMMFPITEFNGGLYFMVPGSEDESAKTVPIWKYDGISFKKAATDGFGDKNNIAFFPGPVYKGYFYCGTTTRYSGAQLWRTKDGKNWENIGKGIIDTARGECYPLGVQNDRLLIGVGDWEYGAKVWSFDGSKFARVNEDGFGVGATGICIPAMYKGKIHLVARLEGAGMMIPLCYEGSGVWKQTAQPGFGEQQNVDCFLMSASKDFLYAGTANPAGAQLWRYDGRTWVKVKTGVNIKESSVILPVVMNNKPYFSVLGFGKNGPSGTGVLYKPSAQGGFVQWGKAGLGDPNNIILIPYLFKNNYIVGTGNPYGFQVWKHPVGPWIDGIEPASAHIGARVRILGSFPTESALAGSGAESYVSFCGIRVRRGDTITWSSSEIVLSVPEGARKGEVYVVTSYGSSNKVHFMPGLSRTYYFAEGTTRRNKTDGKFYEWISVLNPNKENVSLSVTYLVSGGSSPMRKLYRMWGNTRLTIDVASDIGLQKDVSAIVEANKPVVAERVMYFNYRNKWTGGHAVVGAPEPSSKWYFAEGTTRHTGDGTAFETRLCVLNPTEKSAQVKVELLMASGAPVGKRLTVPPLSRNTMNLNQVLGAQKDFGIRIASTVPVVAERSVYFKYGRDWDGGSCALGARNPSNELYFAEGCTYRWADEWLCLQNPGERDAHATVSFYSQGGQLVRKNVIVPMMRRVTVHVPAEIGFDRDVSIKVSSGEPIVGERVVYFNYRNGLTGGHAVLGLPCAGCRTYFAEGSTRSWGKGGFEEWLSVFNPNGKRVRLEITFIRSDGVRTIASASVEAFSRGTFSVNRILGENMDAGVVVNSDLPIVVERPMYFNYNKGITGGHISFGYGL